jgi:hypothetical protein
MTEREKPQLPQASFTGWVSGEKVNLLQTCQSPQIKWQNMPDS